VQRPGVLARVRAAASQRSRAWMRRRQGVDQLPVRLERRRLYILPTRAGVAFAVLLLLMLLAGINYANSLALFLTFVLAGFALVVMQLCHRNLQGTEVTGLIAPAVFAGNPGCVQLALANPSTESRSRLEAALVGSAAVSVELAPHGQRQLDLPVPAAERGIVPLEGLRLTTVHPFGLFRAWTWVHAPLEMLVYPRARGALPMPVQHGSRSSGAARLAGGADEWAGLRPFRDGDSPRQVDWKAYAREAPLLVKEYTQAGAELREFDFAALGQLELEARLSQLARWVVDAEARGERYGLVLPGTRLAPERGPAHRHRCLAALAVFAVHEPQ
jgi:uncharacterized protein (DUF58 family)